MTQNKKIKIIFFSVLTIVFFSSLFVYVSAWPRIPDNPTQPIKNEEELFLQNPAPAQSKASPETQPKAEAQKSPPSLTAQVMIEGVSYEAPLSEPKSVYELLDALKQSGKITFTEKTYSGIGKLITSINGVKSNGNMTWIYYVNDKEAEIGVSQFIINPGDVVSWKYEKVTY